MRLVAYHIVLAILCALLLISPTAASDTSHRAAIEEMLHLAGADQIMEPLYRQLEEMLDAQFAQMGVEEEHRPIVQKYNRKMFQLLREEMSWEVMKNDFINLYLKVFTEEEIDEINSFYRSATGRKMVDKMPQLMRESMILSQRNLERLMPHIQQITEEMTAELQAVR